MAALAIFNFEDSLYFVLFVTLLSFIQDDNYSNILRIPLKNPQILMQKLFVTIRVYIRDQIVRLRADFYLHIFQSLYRPIIDTDI